MIRLIIRITSLSVLIFWFWGCQKEEHGNSHADQDVQLLLKEAKKVYNSSLALGVRERMGRVFPDIEANWNSIGHYNVSPDKNILYVPLSGNGKRILQMVVVKDKQKISAFLSEFTPEEPYLQKEPSIGGISGSLNLYAVNGNLWRSYKMNKGLGSLAIAKPKEELSTRARIAGIDEEGHDDDNDGVVNEDDKCPNTPANTMVKPDGCPVEENLPEVVVVPPIDPFPFPTFPEGPPANPDFPPVDPSIPDGPLGGGNTPSPEELQQKALNNKLCPNSFNFKITVAVDPKAGGKPSGWKVSQLKEIYLSSVTPNYFSALWNLITTGDPYSKIKFQLELGAPATYPDQVLKSAAAEALNITMKEIIMSHGYEGISALDGSGLFGKTFAELAQLHMQAIIPGARVQSIFNTKGIVPTIPISSTNCK